MAKFADEMHISDDLHYDVTAIHGIYPIDSFFPLGFLKLFSHSFRTLCNCNSSKFE